MLRHKNIDRICCIVLALTVLVSGLFVGAAVTGAITEDRTIGYETRLFDQSRVHTIDIVMNEGDWEAFLETCTSEEYASCHLVIDGESYKNVAIRGKGNTSLSNVATYGNDRYSFKVEFDHYQTGHTYHGLDKLSLNNLIQDNTYLKDYFAYTLMGKMGVAAPLCSFVRISVNGEYWGLYLAVEGVEDAFLQRNYGKDYGELYKPDSMSFGGGRGNGRDFDMDEMAEKFGFSFGGDGEEGQTFTMPDMSDMLTVPEDFDPSEMMGSFGGSFGGQSASTATATPEPTATPAPSNDASNGESSGDAANASSGMPATPTDGTMPDIGGSSGMPAAPTDSAMPDMGGSSGMPATPTDGTMPDMGGSSGMPATPTDGTMPDMSNMPQMPTGEMSAEGTMPTDGPMPDMSSVPTMPEGFDQAQRGGNFQMPDMGNAGGGFGGFGSSTDVKLQYSDDDPSSYSNIFNNAKTDITSADQARLIASLKALGEGDTSVVDTDAVIRYMAVHNFLCNDDSYTGMMVHNYYLYEEDGVLSMIPWDYNLAYGTMSGSNATTTVNTDIDTLVSNSGSGDRPMADWIMNSEEYAAQYRAVYQEFMTTAFDSGWFSAEIDRVSEMIAPYVESDPAAFCTYEEFQTGVQTLKAFCTKRAESVINQLSGSNARVDASDINLSAMGTMSGMMGGNRNVGGFGDSERTERSKGRANAGSTEIPDGQANTAPSTEMVPANTSNPGNASEGGRGMTDGAATEIPDGQTNAAPSTEMVPANTSNPGNASEGGRGMTNGAATEIPDGQADAAPSTEMVPANTSAAGHSGENKLSAPDFAGALDMSRTNNGGNDWVWLVACVILLGCALVLAKCWKTNR